MWFSKKSKEERLAKIIIDTYRYKDVNFKLIYVKGEEAVYQTKTGYDPTQVWVQPFWYEDEADDFFVLNGMPYEVELKVEKKECLIDGRTRSEWDKAIAEWKPMIEGIVYFPKEKIPELYRLDDINKKENTFTSCYNLWKFIEDTLPEVAGAEDLMLNDEDDILKPYIKYSRKNPNAKPTIPTIDSKS